MRTRTPRRAAATDRAWPSTRCWSGAPSTLGRARRRARRCRAARAGAAGRRRAGRAGPGAGRRLARLRAAGRDRRGADKPRGPVRAQPRRDADPRLDRPARRSRRGGGRSSSTTRPTGSTAASPGSVADRYRVQRELYALAAAGARHTRGDRLRLPGAAATRRCRHTLRRGSSSSEARERIEGLLGRLARGRVRGDAPSPPGALPRLPGPRAPLLPRRRGADARRSRPARRPVPPQRAPATGASRRPTAAERSDPGELS